MQTSLFEILQRKYQKHNNDFLRALEIFLNGKCYINPRCT